MIFPIATTAIEAEGDIVLVRQHAKRIAAVLGFSDQDQTRIATAVSEIARNAFGYGGGGRADYAVEAGGRDLIFRITISDRGPGIAALQDILDGVYRSPTGLGIGLVGARRLMDQFDIETAPGQGTTVRLAKMLPRRGGHFRQAEATALIDAIRRDAAPDPLSALTEQNRELIAGFAELRARQDDMQRLNRELEDTNRGIVALYSELDQKAEELREASDLKTRFLSYVSHEFRTPLNSIMGLSRILLDRLDGDLSAEQERQVVYIRQSAESLAALVDDLLDLAKVEAGRLDVKVAPFTAKDLFAALRGALKPLQTAASVDLVIDDPPELPLLETDEGKVAQVLRNLVSNALKFTEAGSVRVTAEHRPSNDVLVFTVADTGIGIAPEHLERIFQEFGQVDGPLQRKAKGTGLGLPLSRKLAELMGGRLEVSSEPGRGSTFRMVVPRRYGRTISDGAWGNGTCRILVVDDEEPFRYMIRQILRGIPDLEILEAVDGEDGLAKIAEARPDVIVLDLDMPRRNGFSLYGSLLDQDGRPNPPVLVATSHAIGPTLERRLPHADFLSKAALSRETLLAALDRVTARAGGRS